ncbi:hypothetical protein BC940DRAFT_287457 [Gongronella butleri]|nr:hypothetical protein BC940DRAFT_287457 [Gongronella butleri]
MMPQIAFVAQAQTTMYALMRDDAQLWLLAQTFRSNPQNTTTKMRLLQLHDRYLDDGGSSVPHFGHTIHWIRNELVSLFGAPDQPPLSILSEPLDTDVAMATSSAMATTTTPEKSRVLPLQRSTHASVVLSDAHVLVLGGKSLGGKVLDDIWRYDWATHAWSLLGMHPSAARHGHTAIAIGTEGQLVLQCFGRGNDDLFVPSCTVFDPAEFQWHDIALVGPSRRAFPALTAYNATHALLYGGIGKGPGGTDVLDDIWWLDHSKLSSISTISPISTKSSPLLVWRPLMHASPRAHHRIDVIPESTLIFVHGGIDHVSSFDSSSSNSPEMMVIDVNSRITTLVHPLASSTSTHNPGHSLVKRAVGASDQEQTDNGLSGGAVAGIVIGILVVIAGIGGLSWMMMKRRRKRLQYDLHASRAARFSLSSQPPRSSESVALPRPVMNKPEPARTRLSHMSFGSDFHVSLAGGSVDGDAGNGSLNHMSALQSPSHQLYTNWICETPVPAQLNHASSGLSASPSTRHAPNYPFLSEPPPPLANGAPSSSHHAASHATSPLSSTVSPTRRASHTPSKRFRLSLFRPGDDAPSSPHADAPVPNKRYTIAALAGDATAIDVTHLHPRRSQHQQGHTNDTKRRTSVFRFSRLLSTHDHAPHIAARDSLGAKSVTSVQWVGFNDDMDVVATDPTSSRHLSVMNRYSGATISSSSGILSSDQSRKSLNANDLHHHSLNSINST